MPAPQILKHRGARNRAGRLFRALRLRRRRQRHHHGAAARLPAALLLRQRLCQPHPALPAVSDQALLGALRRPHRRRRSMHGWWTRRAISSPARAARCRQRLASGDAGGERGAGVRARGARCATASARSPRSSRTRTINVAGLDEADVIAAHQAGGQTCVQVFFFRGGSNYGNRAYFPSHDRDLRAAPRCWPPSSASSTTTRSRRS